MTYSDLSHPWLTSVFMKNGAAVQWNVNGSVTPVEYSTGVQSGFDKFYVHRALLCLEDGTGFRAEHFGSLGAALTNGCEFEYVREGTTYDLLDGVKVKTNHDFGRYNYDVDLKTWGAGDDVLLARWSFDRFGGPLLLEGSDSLIWRINDDLTGLTEATIVIQGRSFL